MNPRRDRSVLYSRYRQLMAELYADGALPKKLYAARPAGRAIARPAPEEGNRVGSAPEDVIYYARRGVYE